jgi:putative transposase
MRLFAWVIMPEHVHLVVCPRADGSSVTQFLTSLKRPFAQVVLARWEDQCAAVLPRITDSRGRRHFWMQGGGYDRVIRSESDLREKIEYIHSNPVRRSLVATNTDWKWSSAGWYAGKLDGPVKVDQVV